MRKREGLEGQPAIGDRIAYVLVNKMLQIKDIMQLFKHTLHI